MNRRAFLGSLVGGVAAAAAVRTFPFRVFSFPSEVATIGPKAIRFVEAYDVTQDRFITRFDVLYGFMKLDDTPRLRLDLPKEAHSADMLSTEDSTFLDKSQLRTFLNKVIANHKLPLHADGILPMLRPHEQRVESIRTLSTAIPAWKVFVS